MSGHRNSDYMTVLLAKLKRAWADSPWMSLGELLQAVVGSQEIEFIDDSVLADELDEWVDTLRTWSPR